MFGLPWSVILLGAVSLLTDMSSDMIFPLLPVFVTTTLGGSALFVGLIEGTADTVASVLKLWSGRASDRLPRRKPLVLAGYSLAAVARPLVALATSPWHVLVVRSVDRVGKGIRGAPRDALIADAAGPERAGRAFGLHRAMDHAGAALGPLVAAGLLALGLSVPEVFWLAAIPGALAVVLVLAVREAPREVVPSSSSAPRAPLSPLVKRYCAIIGLFALANSTDGLLLLRATELGVSTTQVPVLWAMLHVVKVLSSTVAGDLSDRVARHRLIVAGWLVYAGTYAGLALASAPVHVWGLFLVYGLYHGLCEPAEKALVRDLVPPAQRGQAYGLYNFVLGIGALPASALLGGAWTRFGAPTAFLGAAALAVASAILLSLWQRSRVRVNLAA